MKKIILTSSIATAAVLSSIAVQAGNNSVCDDYLRNVRSNEKITGMSVAIEQGGKALYEFTDSDGKDRSFSKDTPLHVASITKIFTSTLMIKLMEEGKLSIYDNVRKYISEFPFDNILILHLMTHTSGLRQTGGSIPAQKKLFYKGLVRQFRADTAFQYFSAGYNILGDIIERTSGMPLQDYAQKEIFDKCGMKQTKMAPHVGESGMWTTAGDLLKFSRHILESRKSGKTGILTPSGIDLMFREHTRGRYDRTPVFFQKSQIRDFGRYFADLNSEKAVGHAGSSGCFLLLDPEYDLSIVILSNGSRTIQADDANFIRINNLLMGQFAK